MNILIADKIKKVYGEKTLFENISFGINEGDKLGLIGVNGTGKTTLLKIIAGLEEADSGEVILNNKSSIEYLSQTPDFGDDDTIIDYVIKGKVIDDKVWNIESVAKSILNKLKIKDLNMSIGKMSGGEKKRVALARVLVSPATILILDEPTNHLDSDMIMWLEDYLVKYKGVLIMVTHDRYFLDRVTNKIIELENGNLYEYEANYSKYLELRNERLEREIASNRKRESVLRKELEWVKRGARARSTKQKARLERYESLKNTKGPILEESVLIDSVASRLGKKTLEINNIFKKYDDRIIINDFTYYTVRNDRIGIIGNNGCGKSTLLKLILGNEKLDSGCIEIGETIKIGYYAQDINDMDGNIKVIDYVKDIAEYVETNDGQVSASQMLERFLFKGASQYTPVSKLSGGEKRRLYLLKILMSAPNLLILDEPTNDLDIATLTILEDYLDNFDGIIICVSHDRYFLDMVVSRMFAFEDNGTIVQYEGNYSDYLDKINTSEKVENDKNPIKQTDKNDNKSWRSKETKLKFSYSEKLEFEKIDEEILTLENRIVEVDKEMLKFSSQYTKLNELTMEKEILDKKLEEKMDRWMYLNDLSERIKNQDSVK